MPARGPLWTDDEFVVSLDLYRRVGAVHSGHPEVRKVADLTGRTPASIALRLANWQTVDPDCDRPGKAAGFGRCKPVWDRYDGKPERLIQDARAAAERLRASILSS